jgi:hypothetical protein
MPFLCIVQSEILTVSETSGDQFAVLLPPNPGSDECAGFLLECRVDRFISISLAVSTGVLTPEVV